MSEIKWIASRQYRTKSHDVLNTDWKDILFAISMPREVNEAEKLVDSNVMRYVCTVQFSSESKQRLVFGRDAMEAIFNGILSIEQYLITLSQTQDVENLCGNNFDESIEGFLWGVAAQEYRKNNKK